MIRRTTGAAAAVAVLAAALFLPAAPASSAAASPFPVPPTLQQRAAAVQRALAEARRVVEVRPRADGSPRAVALLAVRPADGAVLGIVDEEACFRRLAAPGSLFKPALAWHLLAAGSLAPSASRACDGRFYLFGGARSGGRLIHEDEQFPRDDDWYKCTRPGGHGRLDLAGALAHSCNTFFYALADRLAPDECLRAALAAGLLSPAAGDWERQALPSWKAPVTRAERILAAVGQGLLTTPAAVAAFACGLANEGRVPPLRRVPATGDLAPAVARAFTHPPAARLVREALLDCVRTGTARALAGPGLPPLAAKTGTGLHGDDIFVTDGWLVSWAPAGRPTLVLVAWVEDSVGNGLPLAASRAAWLALAGQGYFR